MNKLPRLLYPPVWPIAVKLNAMLLLAVILPISILTYYNFRQVRTIEENNEYQNLERLAESTANHLDQLMNNTKSVVLQLSTRSDTVAFLSTASQAREALRPPLQQILKNILNSNPNYENLFLIDKKGLVSASISQKFLATDISSQNYFQQAIQGDFYISNISLSYIAGTPGIFFAAPVKNPSGQILGVAVLKIKAESIWAILNNSRLGAQRNSLLVDRLGIIIGNQNNSLLLHSLAPLSAEAIKQVRAEAIYGDKAIPSLNMLALASAMLATTTTSHTRFYSPVQHAEQIIGCARLKSQSWIVGVEQPAQQVTGLLHDLAGQNILTAMVVGGITSVVALFLARKIVKPISALTQAAQNLEQGEFNSDQLIKMSHSEDDVGNLVSVFLKMTETLKTHENRLKQEVTELRTKMKRVLEVSKSKNPLYLHQLRQKVKSIRKKIETY